MPLFDFLFDLIGTSDSSVYDSTATGSHESGVAESAAINPANGLPMVGGEGGVDVQGNPYGCDDPGADPCSPFDDGIASGIDCGSIGCGGGLDDW